MALLRWMLVLLALPLIGGEAPPELVRYGIDRDGCRVVVDLTLPVLPPTTRAQVQTLAVATIPGFTTGMELSAWIAGEHARMIADVARGKASDPNAAVFNGWYHESIIQTTWSGGGLISLHGDHHGFTGGAHGWLSHTVLVLDATTLTPLTLNDLIAPVDQQTFSTLLTDRWRQDAGLRPDAKPSKHGLFIDELPPALPLITANGIEVIYSPYEVGPWSTGTVRVTLTRQQARPFLRRNPWP